MADSAQTYTDLRSVEQYRKLLRNLHTLNAAESHATLVRMLEGLLASPLGPEEQLEVLESARQTITFVQHEMSSRYAAHPLPPDSQEDATLRQVVRLGRPSAPPTPALPSGSGSDEFRAQWPLLAQRRIQYLGQVIIEYFRAHRAEPPGAWKAVHAAFLEAERAGVTHSRVIDPSTTPGRPRARTRPTSPCCWSTSPTPTAATSASSTGSAAGPSALPPTASCRPTGRRTTPAPTASTSPKTTACARSR
jgi:hypothetical protein